MAMEFVSTDGRARTFRCTVCNAKTAYPEDSSNRVVCHNSECVDYLGLGEARNAIFDTPRPKSAKVEKRDHTRSTGAGQTIEAGSAHYRAMKIQPINFIEANELGYHEGNVVKYVTRWRVVDGLKDLEKAEWYVQRLIENEKKRLAAVEAESTRVMEQASILTREEAEQKLQEDR